MSNICIYHASCTDGFGAAWSVKEYSKLANIPFTFFSAHYNRPPPDVSGHNVVMVDFSYPLPQVKAMLEEAAHITIIDHHATAIEMLKDFEHPNLTKFLDNDKSGAGLAWEYYHSVEKPPLIAHIEDRDLWRFKLPNTKEIIEAVMSYDMKFDVWDSLMEMPLEKLRDEGRVLMRLTNKTIKGTISQKPLELMIGGHLVPVYNITQHISETLSKIASEQPVPFAASFFINTEGYIFSLRSTDLKEDVGAIAKMYGGGGHRNASGFKVSNLEILRPL